MAIGAVIAIAAAAAALLPAPGVCPAPLEAFGPGAQLARADVLALREHLPAPVWRMRDALLHPGLRMQLGPCHRVYPQAGADDDAAPIGVDAPDAGLRWAQRVATRPRGGGPRGSFRITDVDADGATSTALGVWFQHLSDAGGWTAGGRFDAPQRVRGVAWQQRRTRDDADETFVYLPGQRKLRRAPNAWVDGLFLPDYRAGAGVAGDDAALAAHRTRGFTALALRPDAYVWRVRKVRDVLAPLDVLRVGYPQDAERPFGPGGLSAASDRWELRRAVVIEGARRDAAAGRELLTLWIDAQTAQPLYWTTARRAAGRAPLEVGVLLHRYDPALRIFEPVAAVAAHPGGGGWRRESYDVSSGPWSESERHRAERPPPGR